MLFLLTSLSLFLASVHSVSMANRNLADHGQSTWSVSRFNSLVAFGDSYTDENRLKYFAIHNGSAPPAGTFLPESFSTAGGGRTWVRYVIQYTGAEVGGQWEPSMTLYDYAVSGAVCSNFITPRIFSSIHANFPSVLEYELPAFLADKASDRNGTTEAYFTPALTSTDAVYAMWIGTNDIGVDAFLTDSQVPGKALTDYTDCVFSFFDAIYASGGRFFVLLNVAPLNLAPLYANYTIHGAGPNHYWPDMPANKAQIADVMHEYVTTVNNVYKYQTPFEVLVSKRYPGAEFALFDVWQLISDMYDEPAQYFNGSAPANVTGFSHHCNLNGIVCADDDGGKSPDLFLWYDELHPSEQTDRIIARNFVEVLGGTSKYATYYSS